MKFKRLVLTAVDSPRRDLEWRLFLASRLAERGIATVIGPKWAIRDIQSRSHNAILFGRLNSAGSRSTEDLSWTSTFDHRATRWLYFHDEGGLYARGRYDQGVARSYPEPFFSEDYMVRVHFWGSRQASFFASHPAENKFRVTGAPRFDLMRPKYDYIDGAKKQNLLDKFGSYTLICTRFGSANRVDDDAHPLSPRMRDIAVESGLIESHEDHSFIRDQFLRWKKVTHELADFLPAVAELVLAHPDRNFIIRPHPTEKASLYEAAFGLFKNVRIEKAGDVRPLIRGANCVIHSECTTGLEAAINHKPVINFRPWRGENEFEVAGVSEVGAICHDADSLLSRYRDVLRDKHELILRTRADIEDLVANVDDESREATEIIVNDIIEASRDMSGPTFLKKRHILPISRGDAWVLRQSIKESSLWRNISGMGRLSVTGDTKAYDYKAKKVRELWDAFGRSGDLTIRGAVIWITAKASRIF